LRKFAAAFFVAFAWPTEAGAFELSVEGERTFQVAAMSTGYVFGAIHTAVLTSAFSRGKPIDRSWAPGTFLSSVTIAGMHSGLIILASETEDPAWKARYEAASVPGLVAGGAHFGFALDGLLRGEGGFWMDRPAAAVTLGHSASLASLSTVLIAGANSGSSDLSKVPPIFTWAVTGTILAGYSLLSLALR